MTVPALFLTRCCGIDVSHTKLDVCYQNNLGELFHLQVGNNNSGFQKIIEHTGVGYHFVMEATGVYYIRLAFYLHQHSCKLGVENALSIKRYIQMHLERNKSDKKDAASICRYAIVQTPPYWEMPDSAYFESKQLYIRSVSTPSKLNESTTSCTASVYFLCPERHDKVAGENNSVHGKRNQTT